MSLSHPQHCNGGCDGCGGGIACLRDEVERLRDIIGTLYMARGADASALRAGIRAAFGQAHAKSRLGERP